MVNKLPDPIAFSIAFLKGFEPPKPKQDEQDILKTLIKTGHLLQGNAKAMTPDEDSRNGFFALLLSIQGIYVKDQTRWGSSASGKSSGEVDIKIESPDRETEAIIEAFILKNLDRGVIDSHLTKIFDYDANGLDHNFIIVYSEAEDFLALWKKYLDYIPGIDFQHKLLGKPMEQATGFAEIKLAVGKHLRQGTETSLYHVFVNMKPRP